MVSRGAVVSWCGGWWWCPGALAAQERVDAAVEVADAARRPRLELLVMLEFVRPHLPSHGHEAGRPNDEKATGTRRACAV